RVVDGGKLVGIVTMTDLRKAAPPPASSLSTWERHDVLDRVKASEIMTRDVITTTPDTDSRAVASLSAERKIGGLPVVENGEVVGMITESDVFRALVKLLEAS